MTAPADTLDTPNEALSLLCSDGPSPISSAKLTRFEFTSRGDRVPGQLLTPNAGAPRLVLWLRGDHDSSAGDAHTAIADWTAAGAAVACIDLPLFGERASEKLSERLVGGLGGSASPDDTSWHVLWNEFVLQSRVDPRRCLDSAEELGCTTGRVVCVGTGLAAIFAGAFAAADPRVSAAALAPGADALGDSEAVVAASLSDFGGEMMLAMDGGAASALKQGAAKTASSVDIDGSDTASSIAALGPFVLSQLSGG